jgi:hypothetical protein
MSLSKGHHQVKDLIAHWSFKYGPSLHLRWQNQILFSSPISRAWRAIGLCAISMAWVFVLWACLPDLLSLQLPSVRWQKYQELALAVADRNEVLKKQNKLTQSQSDKLRQTALDHQAQIDELTVAWPNSNLRLSLLNQLQSMAQLRGLQVIDLKASQEPIQYGYEVSHLKFSVRGTEWAAHAYWQSLNQLFQNGEWIAWSCRLLPDGQYKFEGQMSLLWDAQDAFTDTGVDLQSMPTPRRENSTSNASSVRHVLPDQSQSQMRVVGAARVMHAGGDQTAWTWIRHGNQIHLVQSGQLLGLEQSQASYSDSQGLWLRSGMGMPDTQLDWDGGKP